MRKQLKNTNSKKLVYRTFYMMATDIVFSKMNNYNNTIDSALALVKKSNVTVDRKKILKGINRNTLIKKFNKWGIDDAYKRRD